VYRYCTGPLELLNASLMGLEFDEYRTFGYDYRCQHSGKTRSQMWVDWVKFYVDTILATRPGTPIVMMSDMIDPAHNGTYFKTWAPQRLWPKRAIKRRSS